MSTIHTCSDYCTGEQDVASQTFLLSLHEMLLAIPSWTSLKLPSFTHCNFQLFLYYAHECSIFPRIIMPAY